MLVLYSLRPPRWKIGDFGTCSEVKSSQSTRDFETCMCSESTLSELNFTRDSRGTDCYRAPEILPEVAGSQPTFNDKSDIWALGCIAFEILHGYRLFSSDWTVIEAAVRNWLPEIPIDERFQVLIPQLRWSNWRN